MTGGLAPAIEFEAEPGGRSVTGMLDDGIEGSDSALAQGALRTLRFAYHAASMGFAAEHDAAYDQLAAGNITAGDFVDAKGTAIAKAWAVGGVSAATGGALGAYGAGLAKALGPRAMAIAEGAIGGMAGGITGAATADAFDVTTGAKDAGDVSGWDWGRAGFYGAAFGAGLSATGVLSSEAARHLPGKRTLGQDLAIRHPQHAGLFDELRLLGERDAVVVHTTLRKLRDWVDAGLLPPGSAGPALAVAGGGQLGDDAAIALTIEATRPLNEPGQLGDGPAPISVLEARTLDGEVLPASESQRPYNPRRTREDYEATHDEVTSSTVPKRNGKNVKLAGQRHQVTGVTFDERGFPVLDDVAVFEARLPSETSSIKDRDIHMRAATRQLHDAIKRGEASASLFNEEQLAAIAAGREKIPGLTWHHHQDVGRMQLVPETGHGKTGHLGGMDMWFGGN
jgi:hypothetical protein